jgi:hypothetical protein
MGGFFVCGLVCGHTMTRDSRVALPRAGRPDTHLSAALAGRDQRNPANAARAALDPRTTPSRTPVRERPAGAPTWESRGRL